MPGAAPSPSPSLSPPLLLAVPLPPANLPSADTVDPPIPSLPGLVVCARLFVRAYMCVCVCVHPFECVNLPPVCFAK